MNMLFIKLTSKEKRVLLDCLGYDVKNGAVFTKKDGEPHICPYTERPVMLEEASVMPGSTVVFNTTELSLAQYFTEHEEKKVVPCQILETTP